MTNTQISPYTVSIDQAVLDDLQRRLAATRFPAPAPDDSWDYGTPVSYLQRMVEAWRRFDWRAQEARMNAVPNFVTEIDGQTIHFVHVRSAEPGAIPLLLLHTYPGSFAEFLDVIGPLTDPVAHGGRAEDAFDVVIPSMPGFGFSTPVVDAGWTMARVAGVYDTLMRRLRYESYGTHGSDGGAMVSRELAVLDPPGFLGAHVLQLFSFPSGAEGEFDRFTPKEYAALEFLGWFQSVGGYNSMNGTRPQTIAAATAVRYHYAEAHAGTEPVVSQGRIGVAVFADDFQTIRPLAERDNARIVHWSEFDRGGHFAVLEAPELVVADL